MSIDKVIKCINMDIQAVTRLETMHNLLLKQ